MDRSNTLPLSIARASNASTTPIDRSSTSADSVKYTIPSQSEQYFEKPRTFDSMHHEENEKRKAAAKDASFILTNGRPELPMKTSSVQTQYMSMLLSLDMIPRLHNIYASFFTWILLAGFIIFPGTFTNIGSLEDDQQIQNNVIANTLFRAFKNMPLLIIATICSGIGAAGMLWLWWRWSANYVWLINKIFLPGCLNSLTGLISSLISVYAQQNGHWSVTAKVTTIVTGACMIILGTLFAIYNFWILERVKKTHSRAMEGFIYGDETLIEKVERKAHEPALEPGSVV